MADKMCKMGCGSEAAEDRDGMCTACADASKAAPAEVKESDTGGGAVEETSAEANTGDSGGEKTNDGSAVEDEAVTAIHKAVSDEAASKGDDALEEEADPPGDDTIPVEVKLVTLPDPADVKSIALIGFGTMGHTWATALLMANLRVFVYEENEATAKANTKRVRGYLKSLKKKDKWDGDVDRAMEKLHFYDSLEGLAGCDAPIFLEVVFESLELKLKLFARLGQLIPAGIIIWTNTSCLNVEKMAEASGHPTHFVGTHGMNPVHLMKGVEIVRHPWLSENALEFTLNMMKLIGKDPFVTENVPGFIVNNGLIPWMIHYVNMLARGQATVGDIDTALKSSLGHPQGVFKLTDFVGVNTTILVAEELHAATLDPRYIAPPLLYAMREAGYDGFGTGRGFYNWSDKRNPVPIALEDLCKPVEQAEEPEVIKTPVEEPEVIEAERDTEPEVETGEDGDESGGEVVESPEETTEEPTTPETETGDEAAGEVNGDSEATKPSEPAATDASGDEATKTE